MYQILHPIGQLICWRRVIQEDQVVQAIHQVHLVGPVIHLVQVTRAVRVIPVVEAVTNLDTVQNYDDLQVLVDTAPESFFDNLSIMSAKFPLYLTMLKLSDVVILKYVNNGLNPLSILTSQNISGYLKYYVRTLEYGVEAVDEMYSRLDTLYRNEAILQRYHSLNYDDPHYDALSEEILNLKFMW